MSEKTRDALRTGIFAGRTFRRETIRIDDDVEIEIRQPSIGEILEGITGDTKEAMWNIVLKYSYVPGTNEKVFEVGDKDAFMNMPIGPWFTQLQEAFSRLTTINVDVAEKNSEKTA